MRWVKKALSKHAGVERLARAVQYELELRRSPRSLDGFQIRGARNLLGEFEPDVADWVRTVECDVFVDVGAHVGLYTLQARARELAVVAVEPHPLNFRLLLFNLMQNEWSDVECHNLALGERRGVTRLYGWGTGASLREDWGSRSWTPVPTTRLDDLLGNRFPAQRLAIKVDAEGSEAAIARGAHDVLRREPGPAWIIEIDLTHAGKPEELVALFERYGYRCRWTADPTQVVGASDMTGLAARARHESLPNAFIFER